MRLPWWGVLCVIAGTILLGLVFLKSGRLDLARPSLMTVAVIFLAIVMRWKLRMHAWFWITIAIFAALHIPLILFVPWTTKWIPAIVTVPIGIADLYLILWVLSVVGKSSGGRKPLSGERPECSPQQLAVSSGGGLLASVAYPLAAVPLGSKAAMLRMGIRVTRHPRMGAAE